MEGPSSPLLFAHHQGEWLIDLLGWYSMPWVSMDQGPLGEGPEEVRSR